MHFLKLYSDKNNKQIENFTEDAMLALTSYDWPGNVRELENAIERAVVFTNGKQIPLSVLPQNVSAFAESRHSLTFKIGTPLRELEHGTPFDDPGERLVATSDGWRAWVPVAPVFPFALLLVPDEQVPDLPTLSDAGRRGLAEILVDVLGRLDRMFAAQTPYMLWIHQRPFDGGEWPGARLHVEIVSPWRAPYVPRYIAAGELGSGVYFNPVAPEAAAESLREAAAVSG